MPQDALHDVARAGYRTAREVVRAAVHGGAEVIDDLRAGRRQRTLS